MTNWLILVGLFCRSLYRGIIGNLFTWICRIWQFSFWKPCANELSTDAFLSLLFFAQVIVSQAVHNLHMRGPHIRNSPNIFSNVLTHFHFPYHPIHWKKDMVCTGLCHKTKFHSRKTIVYWETIGLRKHWLLEVNISCSSSLVQTSVSQILQHYTKIYTEKFPRY